MPQPYPGACLCGAVAWEVACAPVRISHCHCGLCRKAHGAAFATYLFVPRAAFKWLRGADAIARYETSPGNRRPFCGRCGAVVAGESADGARALMPAGNLGGVWRTRPGAHIFCAHKAPWFSITDALPQHAAYPAAAAAAAEAVSEGGLQSAAPLPSLRRPPQTPDAVGGSCLCNAVAFEFRGAALRFYYCHCSLCRRAFSAAHSADVFVPRAAFAWLRGREHLRRYEVSARYVIYFCEVCGAPMPSAAAHSTEVYVPAGALDGAPGIRPQMHIYSAHKAHWFSITDALPQFAAAAPRRAPSQGQKHSL